MRSALRYELLRLIPIASVGVTLGHVFVYGWLLPDPAHRHDVLADTGHGYFPYLIAVSIVFGLLSTWRYFRIGKYQKSEKSSSVYTLIALLFILQSLLFVSIEVLERFFHDGSDQAISFFASSTFVFGMLFQFLTSCIVGVFITTTVAVGKLFHEPKRVRTVLEEVPTLYSSPYVVFIWLSQAFSRAPPSTL